MVEDLDSAALRRAFGRFPTGVTVMTCADADGFPVGLTVNSFASVSLDPPLVHWGLRRAARSRDAFAAAEHFAVNILASGQRDLADQCCRPGDRFHGVDYEILAGAPVIDGSAATLVCRTVEMRTIGDHEIVLGEVTAAHTHPHEPLAFCDSRYGLFRPLGPVRQIAWFDLPEEKLERRRGAA